MIEFSFIAVVLLPLLSGQPPYHIACGQKSPHH